MNAIVFTIFLFFHLFYHISIPPTLIIPFPPPKKRYLVALDCCLFVYRNLQVFCILSVSGREHLGKPLGINLSGRSGGQQMAGGNESQPVLEQQGESSKMTAADSSSNNHRETLTGQSGPMISGSSSPWPYAGNADTTEPPEVVVNNAGWYGRPRVSPAGTLDPSDPQVRVRSGVLRSHRGWYLCAPIHF